MKSPYIYIIETDTQIQVFSAETIGDVIDGINSKSNYMYFSDKGFEVIVLDRISEKKFLAHKKKDAPLDALKIDLYEKFVNEHKVKILKKNKKIIKGRKNET